MSLSLIAAALLRHRYWVIGVGLAVGVLAATSALIQDRTYTTRFTFMPEGGENGLSNLSALAGQFNIRVPGQNSTVSPQLYVELLRSRTILDPLLSDSFAVAEPRTGTVQRRPLEDILEQESQDPRRREQAVREWVRRAVAPAVVRDAGIVRVTVTAPRPELSYGIGARLLELINEFNLHSRQTKAAAEREFIDARLSDAETQLESGESELQQFLEQNRQYHNAPHLVFERERLERRVLMDQQRVVTLREALYDARLAEARDVPQITVVEAPDVPPIPDSRGVARQSILGTLFGAVLAAFTVVAIEAMRRSETDGAEGKRELENAWRQTKADITSLGSPFRRS